MTIATPPAGAAAGGAREPGAAASPSLAALVAEVRRLAELLGTGPLPPWPEARAGIADPVPGRWLRAVVESGALPGPSLRALIEQAFARLAAVPGLGEAATRALTAAREAALAGLGGGPAAPAAGTAADGAALARLATEIRAALAQLGADPPVEPPAVAADPGHAAAAIAGWLREAGVVHGSAPLAPRAVALGAARALEAIERDGAGPDARATLEAARELLVATVVAPRPGDPAPVLYRPAPGSAAGTGPAAPGRVAAIGEEDADGGRRRRPVPGEREPPAPVDDAQATPLACVRRAVAALLAGDTAAFVAEWVYPACIFSDGRWAAQADEAALAAWLAARRRADERRGMPGGRIALLRADTVGARVALVYALIERDPAAAGSTESELACLVVRTAPGWKVAVALDP